MQIKGGFTVAGGHVHIDLNTAPVVPEIDNFNINEGQSINFNVNASDLEGDPLTYTLTTAPAGANITSDGQVTWTSTNNGSELFVVEVSDGRKTTIEEFTVVVGEVAPTVNPVSNINTVEGTPLTAQISATHPTPSTLSYAVISGPGTVDGNGLWSYTPVDNGTETVTIRVSKDGGSLFTDVSFDVVVADIPPTIQIQGSPGVSEGTEYTLEIQPPVDPGTDTVTNIRVNWGDGTFDDYPAAGNVTHTYAGDAVGVNSISVDLTNEDNIFTTVTSQDVEVFEVPPSVSQVADQIVLEGSPASAQVVASHPTSEISYAVISGPGTVDASGLWSYTPSDNMAELVTIRVSRVGGSLFSDVSFSITATDVDPSIVVTGPGIVSEGSTYNLTLGAITDPGTDTVNNIRVDWGDGTFDDYTTTGVKTHVYNGSSLGLREIQVHITNEDGTFTNAGTPLTIEVQEVPPAVNMLPDQITLEGSQITQQVVATHPTSGISYEVVSGPGTINSSGLWSYTPADNGVQAVTIRVSRQSGTLHTDVSFNITATDVDPSIVVAGASSVPEGSTYALTLGTITDPGADTVTNIRVNWGDGSHDDYTETGVVFHNYAGNALGNRVITVDITNEDGTFTNVGTPRNVLVTEVAPTLNAISNQITLEGSAVTAQVSASHPTSGVTYSVVSRPGSINSS